MKLKEGLIMTLILITIWGAVDIFISTFTYNDAQGILLFCCLPIPLSLFAGLCLSFSDNRKINLELVLIYFFFIWVLCFPIYIILIRKIVTDELASIAVFFIIASILYPQFQKLIRNID